jgi:uncharacterized protein
MALASIVSVVLRIALGLTRDFLVDGAWVSAIGDLNVFWTMLGGKALLCCAVFVGSALLLGVNGSLAARFARRRGDVRPVDVARASVGGHTLPELLERTRQRLPWRLLIAGGAGLLGILVAAGEVYGGHGGIAFDERRRSMSSAAIIHGSALLGLFCMVQAWSDGLDRFRLLDGDNGVGGASDTDVHVDLPVLWLLVGLAMVAAVLSWATLWVCP